MLKKLVNRIFLFFLIAILPWNSIAVSRSIVKIRQKRDRVIDEYLSVHKKFFKDMCPGGTEKKYWDLFRDYRGEGFFIPVLTDTNLDVKTIVKNLPLVKQKIDWISKNADYLGKVNGFGDSMKQIKAIRNQLKKLLDIKEKYRHEKSKHRKELHLLKSEQEYVKLRKGFNKLVRMVHFLTSFKFPVDHFGLRKTYDNNKDSDDIDRKKTANNVYFIRKVVQDGAMDPNRSRSDRYLRASIDTLYLKMNQRRQLVTEDLRYDLNGVLRSIEAQLKRGAKKQKERAQEWKERTKISYDFYNSLLEKRDGKQIGNFKSKELLKKKSLAKYNLKHFTLDKQKVAYDFWSKQTEAMKALFVIETILFNEVGDVDGQEALERRDVTQVVINRKSIPFYNNLEKDDFLYPYLSKIMTDDQIQQQGWLNILYKTGEFSFTYYFIPGSLKIYCPDMSKRGKKLRRQNLEIAINLLRQPNHEFKAIRYFSRASMLGRIDMTFLWDDYIPIAERPGQVVKANKKLRHSYKRGNYQYYYTFKGPMGREFDVIEIRDRTYALYGPKSDLKFFNYRNPHYFKYFSPMKNASLN